MEGMTSSQIVRYMRAVAVQTLKNPTWQFLAGAFNMNTTLVDDMDDVKQKNGGKPKEIIDRVEIARRGIELVNLGGWPKVTFDGAGDFYPSIMVIDQISHEGGVLLNHLAHERGLITYFSAGFKVNDNSIERAVYCGVDGIGVG